MSVSLGLYKGSLYDNYNSKFIKVIPVSFQDVGDHVWSQALTECNIKVFVTRNDFSVKQIPEVLAELDRIYDWIQINGDKDKAYISRRIYDELKPFLIQFYDKHKDEDYWFDLG